MWLTCVAFALYGCTDSITGMQVCVVAKDMKRTRGLPATTVKKTPVQCRAHFVKQKAALRSAAKALAEAQAAYEQKQQKREEHFQMQAGRDAHLMSTVLSAWTKFVNEARVARPLGCSRPYTTAMRKVRRDASEDSRRAPG